MIQFELRQKRDRLRRVATYYMLKTSLYGSII